MEQAAESLKGKKVLVVRLSALGDVVQTLPAVERLAAAGATVDWLTQPAYAALARCCPLVRRVLEFPRRHFFRRAAACARALRQEHYDLALDLQGLLKSALGARAARAATPRWNSGSSRASGGVARRAPLCLRPSAISTRGSAATPTASRSTWN